MIRVHKNTEHPCWVLKSVLCRIKIMNADFMKGKIKIEKIIGRIKKRNLRKFYNNYNSKKGKLCV